MVLSGSYDNYHFADSVNTGGGNQVSQAGIYLGTIQESLSSLGWFPTNDTEKDLAYGHDSNTMDYENAIGITCMEISFYLDTYTVVDPAWSGSNSGLKSYLMFSKVHFTDNSNARTTTQIWFTDLNDGTTSLSINVKAPSPSGTTNNQIKTAKFIINNIQDFLNLHQWYHLVIRLHNPTGDRFEAEILIGNTGKSKDGTSSGVTESILQNPFGLGNSSVNAGFYIRFVALLEDGNQLTCIDMFMGRNSPAHGECTLRFALGTQASQSSVGNKLARNFIGGLAEFRLWKSKRRDARAYSALQQDKFLPVVYDQTGDYQNLAHCFRLNQTGVTTATDYTDLGEYNAIFTDAGSSLALSEPSYLPYETGYPYDISSHVGATGEIRFVTAEAIGSATALDFLGQQFATGAAGQPYYREALPDKELNAIPGIADFNELASDQIPVRIAIDDYYNGLRYLLPGTGQVLQDDETNAYYLQTVPFYPLAGRDVVYSKFYIIENNSLIGGGDFINYYANPSHGPFIYVVNDTGRAFFGDPRDLL